METTKSAVNNNNQLNEKQVQQTPGLQKSKLTLKKTNSIKKELVGIDHSFWHKFKVCFSLFFSFSSFCSILLLYK